MLPPTDYEQKNIGRIKILFVLVHEIDIKVFLLKKRMERCFIYAGPKINKNVVFALMKGQHL